MNHKIEESIKKIDLLIKRGVPSHRAKVEVALSLGVNVTDIDNAIKTEKTE